jgi:RND superfamily putative drug exporter
VIATLYPATAPRDQRTVTPVNTLRGSLIPQAEHGGGLVVHVGGQTATAIDFAHVLAGKLPLFAAVVVILAFALLTAVFGSLLIPLAASALNLLSVVAALGAITAVFTRGWGGACARARKERPGATMPPSPPGRRTAPASSPPPPPGS